MAFEKRLVELTTGDNYINIISGSFVISLDLLC